MTDTWPTVMLCSHSIRSREARATAEQEFLSSTSEEVSEFWSGRGIVRVADKPKHVMKDLLVVESGIASTDTRKPNLEVLDIAEAYNNEGSPLDHHWRDHRRAESEIKHLKAPCITLNVHGTILGSKEIWFWAIIGIILQLFAIAFPALATYHWKWVRKGVSIPTFAYYCFVPGTITMLVGLLGCGHIVEASTTELTFRPATWDSKVYIQRIFRLQMDCTVSGHHFPSFAILNDKENKLIRTSRLNNKNYK